MRTTLSRFAFSAVLMWAGAVLLMSCESQDNIEDRMNRQRHVIGGDASPDAELAADEGLAVDEGAADEGAADEGAADEGAADEGSAATELAEVLADGSESQDAGAEALDDLRADDKTKPADDEADLDDLVDTPAADPVAEAPVAEAPVAEDPVAEDPVAEDPVAEDPVAVASAEDSRDDLGPAGEPSDAQSALRDLKHINEAKGAEAKYHVKKGDDAYAGGHFHEAIEHYEQAVSSNPFEPKYLMKLSRAKFQIGDRTGESPSISGELFEHARIEKQQALREIDLRLEKAQVLLVDGDVDGAYEAASLAVDSIALNPELAGKERGDQARRLLDKIRRERRQIDQRRHDAARERSNDEAERQLAFEAEQKREAVQDLLRKSLQSIRSGEYRKVEELCQTVLAADPDNRVAAFWLRSARDRLLKERQLKVIEDRIEAREALAENFLEATTPYDSIFVFPDDEYWQRVRMRKDRLQPRQLDDPEPIRKAKAALESTLIDVTFEESPLQQVIDHFKSVVGINILISPEIDPEDEALQVSQPINQLSAMSALRLILTSKELGFTFQENTLVITSADEAQEPTEFEIYNVSDLLMKIRDFAAPEIRLKGAGEDDASAPISFTEEFSEEEDELDPDQLMELIQESSGGEDVWDGEVNKIDHQRGQLLVNATRDLHKKVRDVLANLRKDSDLYVVIEARFIDINDDFLEDIGIDSRDLGSVNNLGMPFGGVLNSSSTGGNDIGIVQQGDVSDVDLVMGLDRWAGRVQHVIDGFTGTITGENLNAGNGIGGGTFQATWLEPFQVNVILRAVQEELNVRQLTAPVVTAHNNERVYVSVITQRAYIADYELVSGGTGFAIIEVADPVIQTFQEGVILDVDPTISHDKKYITLDVRPTLATLIGGVISTINISLGSFSSVAFQVPIGIPQISLQQSFTSVTVPNGGTVLLGGFKSLDEGKFQSYLPIIGDIPILKNLARRKATMDQKRSLVILLTARIVDLRDAEERRFNPQ